SNVSTLHVTNGDCAGDTLRRFADGPVVITCDVLHQGPAPAVDGDAWYSTRARFLADDEPVAAARVAAGLAASDRAMGDALARGDEIVLWFEHDLFDQLLLIRVLDLIGRRALAPDAGRVSLICVDRFPGVDRFIGLGQLDAAQLQSLYPSRQPVTADQLDIASAAWSAFRSPDPRKLLEITVRPKPDTTAAGARDGGGAPLPFLRDALLRFLAEYPSASNGLTRTEQLALAAMMDGPTTAGALFMKTQGEELRPFMGDSTFFDTIRALASARTPLVEIDAPVDRIDIRDDRVAITAA